MNRLGIFVFYDADGIVDEFIPYLLDDLQKDLSRLVIICNGFVNEEGRIILEKYTDEILERENADYDGGAYRYILREYLSRSIVEQYDELLLFNDTFCGPFYSFDEVFKKMEAKEYDVWGLSMHGECLIQDERCSEHIQSYFINICKTALKSNAFWEFWDSMDHANDFNEAVSNFEIAFSESMKKAGLKLGAYLYIDKYMSSKAKDNFNYSQIICGEVVDEFRFPVFKRKNLMNQSPSNDEIRRAIDFIYNHYKYPLDYLWKPVFRKFELGMLNASFGLNHAIRKKSMERLPDIKILCLLYSELPDFDIDLQDMIKQLPHNVETRFCGEDPVLYLQKNGVLLDKYDYIGVIRDSDYFFDGEGVHRLERLMQRDYLFRRTLMRPRTIAYLSEIAKYQSTIGLVYADISANDSWRTLWCKESWGNLVKSLLKKYDIKFQNTTLGIPVYGRESFWCASDLLKESIEYLEENDLKAWYLALPYLTQHLGRGLVYYHDDECADSLIGESKYLLGEAYKVLIKQQEELIRIEQKNNELLGKISLLDKEKLIEPQELRSRVEGATLAYYGMDYYLYGCGLVSKQYSNILKELGINVVGYLVTDASGLSKNFCNKPVIELKDYKETDNSAVLIAVGEKLKKEVKQNLKEAGIQKVTYVDKDDRFKVLKRRMTNFGHRD